jgi:hypothetical protein
LNISVTLEALPDTGGVAFYPLLSQDAVVGIIVTPHSSDGGVFLDGPAVCLSPPGFLFLNIPLLLSWLSLTARVGEV